MESTPHTNEFFPHVPLQLSGVKVKSIKAGLYKLVFLDEDGCVWTVNNRTEETWEKHEHSCRVVDVYAGYFKIVINDEENMVWQSSPNGLTWAGKHPPTTWFAPQNARKSYKNGVSQRKSCDNARF